MVSVVVVAVSKGRPFNAKRTPQSIYDKPNNYKYVFGRSWWLSLVSFLPSIVCCTLCSARVSRTFLNSSLFNKLLRTHACQEHVKHCATCVFPNLSMHTGTQMNKFRFLHTKSELCVLRKNHFSRASDLPRALCVNKIFK